MPNAHFLFGNDEFAISRRIKEFESDFEDPTSADMNTARLDARSMSEDDLGNAANAIPFLAKRRLVLLANPSSKYNNPSARKKFLEFLGKIPETTRLVVYESVEPKEAEKHWLVKWAEKNNKVIQSRAYMLPRLKDMEPLCRADLEVGAGVIGIRADPGLGEPGRLADVEWNRSATSAEGALIAVPGSGIELRYTSAESAPRAYRIFSHAIAAMAR